MKPEELALLKIIFPKNEYLWHLYNGDIREGVEKVLQETYDTFFKNLGVKKRGGDPHVYILTVTLGAGPDGVCKTQELLIDFEEKYGRKLDLSKIQILSFSNPDAASKSPYLELASFIYFPGQDEPGAENYPYLAEVLPCIGS